MTYEYDLTKLVIKLTECADSAKELMRNHSDRLEPWLWHRADEIAAGCKEAAAVISVNCKEVS